MRYFCTYFDRHYLTRALALYQSLQAHAGEFTLWALCFDEYCYDVLTRLNRPGLCPVALSELESADPELLAVRPTRSRVEYYFTCSPCLPLFLMPRVPVNEVLTYLDADLFFFSNPEPIYAEMDDAAILIVGHRFAKFAREQEINGIYNVGLTAFCHEARGLACLRWWREQCLNWCYDRHDAGRFADQKYLDDWPTRFPGTHVLQHKGAGLAPWNWANYSLAVRDGHIWVDDRLLIFFHYHALKIFNRWLYDPVRTGKIYGEMPRHLLALFYPPYLKVLNEQTAVVRAVRPDFQPQYDTIFAYGWRVFLSKVRRGKLTVHRSARP